MPAKKNIEYVLQSKNNDGGAGNARGGSKDEKRKEHDRSSGKRTDADDASRREGGRQKGAALSKDQAMNILKAMKQKPVRRQRMAAMPGGSVKNPGNMRACAALFSSRPEALRRRRLRMKSTRSVSPLAIRPRWRCGCQKPVRPDRRAYLLSTGWTSRFRARKEL